MSSHESKRKGSRAKSSSPTSSPPLPPAPIPAQNKGSATHRRRKASVDAVATPPESNRARNRRSGSSRHSKAEVEPQVNAPRPKKEPIQPPPAAENGYDLAGFAVPVPGSRKSSVRRFITRLLVLYLGYTLFFVCPKSTAKDTNAICEGVSKLRNWLLTYSDPMYETYRTYAEPYVDQYGRPLYEQGQKYYVEVAQPAFKTASDKARTSYDQYAQPYVVKVTDTIYTDDVKDRLNRAQKQIYGHAEYAKRIYRDGQEQVWQLYDEHVQPIVSKVSPHAKYAWDRASVEAGKAYDTVSVFYMKNVDPYAQHSFAVILDAAANAKESFARHTDEIWGTRFSKQNQSKPGKAASRAAKKAQEAAAAAAEKVKEATEKVKQTKTDEDAKQTKADASAQAETLKDAFLNRAADAQKAVTGEAERLKKLAEAKVQEAGKFSEEFKKTVVQKAHEVQEAVTQKAESIRHSAQEQVQKVQEAGAHLFEALHHAKGVAQDSAKDAQESAQEQASNLYGSTEQIVMDGKERLDRQAEKVSKAKDNAKEKVEDAGEQIKTAKDTVKDKAHDASAASKASLAAMLAGIEASFGKFYEYEDTETKNLWSNLQSSIDEHIAMAKNTARDLEKANREVYDSFESYVRDWRNQGGNLEDRLADLHHHSVESIKDIVLKSSDDLDAAKSKAKVMSNNVEVYLSGLKGFLEDRLAASKETVASELSAFKGTSSEDDKKVLIDKIAELDQAAKSRLDQAGQDAHNKVQELLHQVSELWSESEDKSQEFVQLTRNLAKKTREDAKAESHIRIATEEPGSGHRHHRH
ncbi:hypothetical protein BGX21_010980 [Mortierella sp. AD011]|nr:hypothetical protein BGX20_002494 [Mortierella sp. AD010]KAF9402173.1 hypothetical protein BGX21_010980 [Mortierella sp. AD011]